MLWDQKMHTHIGKRKKLKNRLERNKKRHSTARLRQGSRSMTVGSTVLKLMLKDWLIMDYMVKPWNDTVNLS